MNGQLVSPIYCFFRPKQLLLNYSSQVSVLLMIAISVERIIAVVWFRHFAQIRYRTAVVIAILSFLYPACIMCLAGFEAFLSTKSGKMITAVCLEGPVIFNTYESIFKILLGFSSVIIYAVMLAAYRKRVAPMTFHSQTKHRNPHLIFQRRLTQTLSILTLCTLIFFCIPHTIVAVLEKMNIFSFNSYLWILVRVHCLSHVVVFIWRHEDIRHSVRKMFCCFTGLLDADTRANTSQAIEPFE